MSDAQNSGTDLAAGAKPMRLRDALRQARIEAADRTGVVVDLRDAEVARLEILNEALDPLFAQIPEQFANCAWHVSWHVPFEQTSPAGHAIPHAPQFTVSVERLSQLVPHWVRPCWQETWQVPL